MNEINKKFIRYIIIDPINRNDSGITSYCKNLKKIIEPTFHSVFLLSKGNNENESEFRLRIQDFIDNNPDHLTTILEAPETNAITTDLELSNCILHIRLHFSKSLGQILQFKKVNYNDIYREQKQLDRARIISAPSVTAAEFSKAIYNIKKCIAVYPNPAPGSTISGNDNETYRLKKPYFLFVGRPHQLKGFPIFLKLAHNMPNVSFIALVPDKATISNYTIPSNISIIEDSSTNKKKLYLGARAVVIPSLFETASMVGIEAMSCGTPVVCWEHLGIVEYAPRNLLHAIEPWNIAAFVDKLIQLSNCEKQLWDVDNHFASLNNLCLIGVQSACNSNTSTVVPNQLGVKTGLDTLLNSSLRKVLDYDGDMKQNNSRWKRKLNKLRRDPKQFFRDSWILSWKSIHYRSSHSGVQMKLNDDNGRSSRLAPSAKDLEVTNAADIIPIKSHQQPLLRDVKRAVFTNITSSRIEFNEPPEKPIGLISAVLCRRGDEDLLADVTRGFDKFTDFRYLQQPMLQIGTFDPEQSTPLAIIDRIDVKNKKIVSLVDHIILINPSGGLVSAIRSCGTRQRTIVVVTDPNLILPDPTQTDVLILSIDTCQQVIKGSWRRIIKVKSSELLYLAIRRAVQEGSPKEVDWLLPIKGYTGNHRNELIASERNFYQGIIHLSSEYIISGASVNEIVEGMSDYCTDLAVSESVYLRYKTLCEGDFTKQKFIDLISFCLYDGVIFDVRT
ncbi:glycosyltransferase [Brucella pseudogrignonensis]|uniref:Glycosyltransferase involved in cell wall biosynthesis n=1 Tax=Brucella pseudogrignonensis TaxID=419475 RepID=A0ABU1MF43_9HYPH|nr:glycosyltransferase [Brucella pseudogrignonensis]MDR6434670.1 glycosyltransferase involved in cell wall biosynthesis [Brucella pseudogrignonensis]